MAKARALDKRRKSIRNIRKITRTMELIATAKFKKAMDRATAATAYTKKITEVVTGLAKAGLQVSHPLLEAHPETKNATLLILTANRGLCGGYNGSVLRAGLARLEELKRTVPNVRTEISGKRGLAAFKFRKLQVDEAYTKFEDQPKFEDVELIANRFLEMYITGKIDRLDVAYVKFISSSRQVATVETLLPFDSISGAEAAAAAANKAAGGKPASSKTAGDVMYEFMPSAESILEEVVPASFRAKLFKCFLDAAVSEQIARMVAMKSATENASEMIKSLSTTYNRARQSQITGEIMEIIGGVEALNK
jgi:F-type H+-transporting ATPase subunit gamma